MELRSPEFDVEIRPDRVNLQFVKDGNSVQISLSEPEFWIFRDLVLNTGHQLVRDRDQPNWAYRTMNAKWPKRR